MNSISVRLILSVALLLALGDPLSSSAQSPALLAFSTSEPALLAPADALPDSPGALQTAQPAPPAKAPEPSGLIAPGQSLCEKDAIRKQTMTPEQLKAEESQYIGGIVPNFNTVTSQTGSHGCVPALKPGQKWNLVYHSATAAFTIGLDVLLAGYDEIDGSHNGYGWGAQGYFKRFGAQYADTVSSAVIGNAILPIVLHQDPRYYQIGPGHPVVKRVVHAALSTIICKGDSGKTQFNYSNVFGNFLSGALSNLYYPSDERGIGLTFSSALTVTAEGAFGAQLLEFSTELSRLANHISHHKPKDPTPEPAPAAPTAQAPTPPVSN